MISHAIRLLPGADLKKSIVNHCRELNIVAGYISTCVGSLTQYHLRFANRSAGDTVKGHFEIISLNGTICMNGCHLHLAIADESGRVVGGHLLDGNIIYTTAELVLVALPGYLFNRVADTNTGFAELEIKTV